MMAIVSGRIADVLWLGDPACHDPSVVGGKAAQLSRLAAWQSVPPGFCLTVAAFQRGAAALASVTEDLRVALESAYATLSNKAGARDLQVAVRSSAVDEDGLATSFAGQHQTFLNVTGFQGVTRAVEQCWASFSTEQVLDYRRRHGLALDSIGIAVLVQQLVTADVSVVLFSANPVTGNRDEVVITANWGLGESLVGGTTTPDAWTVARDTRQVIEQRIGAKERMTVPVPGGTREVDVPRLLRGQRSLSDAQIMDLVELGLTLEEQMGWPVDIECAYAGGQLYLLQCRPITTLAGASPV